jgi:uncharacterized protein
LLDGIREIIIALGGENWHRKFLELASREEKENLKDTLSMIKFFLNIIMV